MRNPLGYATIFSDSGVNEIDTFTCFHCSYIVHVKPLMDAADLGGLCKVCMKLVCKACNAKGSCTPWEKQLEQMEARERFIRQCGL